MPSELHQRRQQAIRAVDAMTQRIQGVISQGGLRKQQSKEKVEKRTTQMKVQLIDTLRLKKIKGSLEGLKQVATFDEWDEDSDETIGINIYIDEQQVIYNIATEYDLQLLKFHIPSINFSGEDEELTVGSHVAIFDNGNAEMFYDVMCDVVTPNNVLKPIVKDMTTGLITLEATIDPNYSKLDYRVDGLPAYYDPSHVANCPICDAINPKGYKCKCEEKAKELWSEDGYGLLEYDYTPEFIVHSLNNRDQSVKMGLELEAIASHNRHPMTVPSLINSEFVYFKRDGSLPDNGFEMVTMPFTFNWYSENKDNDIFNSKLFNKMGIKSKDRDETGIHIHIDKKSFKDDDHFNRWYALLSMNLRYLEKIAGRTCGTYCRAVSGVNVKKSREDSTDRYDIISNRGTTIEFRLFNGDIDRCEFAVEFIASTVEWSRKDREVLGWTRYKKWLRNNIDTYSNLKEFFIDNKVPKGVTSVVDDDV